MTEIRESRDGNGLGLFASKAYQQGDIIVNEIALLANYGTADFNLDDNTAKNDSKIQSQFSDLSFLQHDNNTKISLACKPFIPSQYSNEKKAKHDKKSKNNVNLTLQQWIGKWKGMIIIAASFAWTFSSSHDTSDNSNMDNSNTTDNSDTTDTLQNKKKQLLSLYHPPISGKEPNSDPESEIIQIAQSALNYCIQYATPNSALSRMLSNETSKKEVLQIMLIWICNAFEAGLLFPTICRINHSCDPNCVVQTSSNTSTTHLQRQMVKAITPIKPGDELFISYLGGIYNWTGGMARQQILLQTRHFLCTCSRCASQQDYASAIPCPSCHPRQGPGNKYLDEDVQWDDDHNVSYAYPKNASCDTTSYRCQNCKESTQYLTSPILKIGKKVMDKVFLHIQSLPDQKLSVMSSKSSSLKHSHADLVSIHTEMDEQLYQLSSSILGANHWCTNIMMLLLLDRMLASFNAILLLNQTFPDMTELAEAIDSLQRLWNFSSNLHLQMDSAPFLLHKQTVGIARALVALGDAKSMKYGSEWVMKVEHFYDLYESEDMQKVVQALKGAWEQRPASDPNHFNDTNDDNTGMNISQIHDGNDHDMNIDENESNRQMKRIKK